MDDGASDAGDLLGIWNEIEKRDSNYEHDYNSTRNRAIKLFSFVSFGGTNMSRRRCEYVDVDKTQFPRANNRHDE